MVSQNDKVHYSAGSFSFFCWLSQGLVVWPRLDDLLVSQNPKELCVSHFLWLIPGCVFCKFFAPALADRLSLESTCVLISNSSSQCTNPLVTVPSGSFTIGITVTFMFNSLFVWGVVLFCLGFFFWGGRSLTRSKYLSLFLPSFNFYKVHNSINSFFLFFFCWLSLSLVVWLRLGDPFVCQNPYHYYCMFFTPILCLSFSLGQIFSCACTICSYVQIYSSSTIPCGSPCPPSRVL